MADWPPLCPHPSPSLTSCNAFHLVLYLCPPPVCLKIHQVRSCCLAEFEDSSSVLKRSYSSRGTEKTLNTPRLSARRKRSPYAETQISQLPPRQGQRSSWGKECSNCWVRIRLLFLHENFIGIAFQINMSVKVKGRLLIKCLFADMSRNSSVPRLAQFSQHPSIDPPFECRTTCRQIRRQGTLNLRDGCGCIRGGDMVGSRHENTEVK